MARHEGTNATRSQADREADAVLPNLILAALVVGGLIVLAMAEAGYRPEWIREAEEAGRINNTLAAEGISNWR